MFFPLCFDWSAADHESPGRALIGRLQSDAVSASGEVFFFFPGVLNCSNLCRSVSRKFLG